jgi:hypothetical protein
MLALNSIRFKPGVSRTQALLYLDWLGALHCPVIITDKLAERLLAAKYYGRPLPLDGMK